MYLTEYQKISVDNFMGLWDRGSLDDVPPDHASDILNMAFARKREVLTRPGTNYSRNMPNGRPIIRMFDAAFDNSILIPLAMDDLGNLWRLDAGNESILMSFSTAIDFTAVNMNNHVYIAPMFDGSVFLPDAQVIYVWDDEDHGLRRAAGSGPSTPILNVLPAAGDGNVGPGWYGATICWVYSTGYVSPPGPVTVGNFPVGNTPMELFGIPGTVAPNLYPPGVVSYIILVTKAQATAEDALRAPLYEFGTNTDIASNVISINFFDTDLVILASNDPINGNLFNSMPRLPTGFGGGSVALIKYHNRMIIIGPNLIYPPNYVPGSSGATNYEVALDGRIFVSHPGAPENFDTLTGFLVIDPEFDGNIPRTGFELFGVLYICKAVGTFAAQDNGSDPSDATNPWVVNRIDGGIGAYHNAVGTITGTQPGLSFNSTAFLANRNGLFLFNGNVLRPELSWKIRGLWQKMTLNLEYKIRVTVDIYNDIFYVFLPITGPLGPNVILAADYSLGLDSNNIRWSIYQFPWGVYDIIMAAWPDPVGTSYYYLRLGTQGTIYKLDGATTADQIWSGGVYQSSNPILNYYQSSSLILGDVGSLNICRFIRYRMAGQGTLFTILQDEGALQQTQVVNVHPDPFPGNYKDIGLQTNFTNEKVIVRFEMNNLTDYVRMSRFDVFGKSRWPTRPNA